MNDNPMTAKEYLSQAYRIDQRINAKLEQAERLRGTPVLLPADIGAAFSSTLRQMRLREGRTTAAAEVHHIVPLADSGTHAWDNLRALCKRCHSRITATEGGRWRK